jgi:hypothetical protein
MYQPDSETMIKCPQCAAAVDCYRGMSEARVCPKCGGTLADTQSKPWTDVARVTNLAEAGFLTDELNGLGIEARIQQADEFNALHDRWNSRYLIQTPADLAAEAATQLQQYVSEERHGESDAQPFEYVSGGRFDPQFWRPVALVVLTGIASFLLGQKLTSSNEARRPSRNSLPSTVDAIGRPFVTEAAPGNPRFRLSFDSGQQTWLLDTDRNNDGRYESRRQFYATGAAR